MKMVFKATTNGDGTIHVTNTVMGMIGQHHVHTPEGLKRWQETGAFVIPDEDIHWLDSADDCDCGEPVDRFPV